MSIAEDIAAAASEVGASAQAAADRVTAALGTLRTQLADASAQIQEFIDSDSADTLVLTGALDTLTAADATIDSIEAAPIEEPPVEEPPVEEPPVEEPPAEPPVEPGP